MVSLQKRAEHFKANTSMLARPLDDFFFFFFEEDHDATGTGSMFLTEQLGVGGAEALIEAVCVFFPASCLLTARLKVAPVHPEPCRLPCVWKGAKGVMGTPGWGCERGLGTSAAPWSECRGWPRGHQCCCARRRGLSGM